MLPNVVKTSLSRQKSITHRKNYVLSSLQAVLSLKTMQTSLKSQTFKREGGKGNSLICLPSNLETSITNLSHLSFPLIFFMKSIECMYILYSNRLSEIIISSRSLSLFICSSQLTISISLFLRLLSVFNLGQRQGYICFTRSSSLIFKHRIFISVTAFSLLPRHYISCVAH